MICPRCSRRLIVTPTCYGKRAICSACNVRWTRIEGYDTDWVAEKR